MIGEAGLKTDELWLNCGVNGRLCSASVRDGLRRREAMLSGSHEVVLLRKPLTASHHKEDHGDNDDDGGGEGGGGGGGRRRGGGSPAAATTGGSGGGGGDVGGSGGSEGGSGGSGGSSGGGTSFSSCGSSWTVSTPAEQIVRYCMRHGMHVVVLGARPHHGSVARTILGSVSDPVVTTSHIPCLVVRRGGVAAGAQGGDGGKGGVPPSIHSHHIFSKAAHLFPAS